MKFLNKYVFFLLIFCFNIEHGFSVNSFKNIEDFEDFKSPLIEQIITNNQGVFVLVNDFWICGKAFHASENEMLIHVNGEWMTIAAAIEDKSCIRKAWKCSRCGRYNMDGINACPYCGKPKNG